MEIPIGTNSETAVPQERSLISELLSCDIKLSIGHVLACSQNASPGYELTQFGRTRRNAKVTSPHASFIRRPDVYVRLNLSAILKYNTERIVRSWIKESREEGKEDGGCLANAFTKKRMKVWNVQRYDKLNLVKSFLLTLAAEDLIWRAASDALRRAKNKLLYLREDLVSAAPSNIFRSGHFAIIRLPTG